MSIIKNFFKKIFSKQLESDNSSLCLNEAELFYKEIAHIAPELSSYRYKILELFECISYNIKSNSLNKIKFDGIINNFMIYGYEKGITFNFNGKSGTQARIITPRFINDHTSTVGYLRNVGTNLCKFEEARKEKNLKIEKISELNLFLQDFRGQENFTLIFNEYRPGMHQIYLCSGTTKVSMKDGSYFVNSEKTLLFILR